MTTQAIINILYDLSETVPAFPIRDLTRIIADYVYELPCECIKTINARSLHILKNGKFVRLGDNNMVETMDIKDDDHKINATNRHGLFLETKTNFIYNLAGDISIYSRAGDISIYSRAGVLNASLYIKHCRSLIQLSDGCIAVILLLGGLVITDKAFARPTNIRSKYSVIMSICEMKNGYIAAGIEDGTVEIWDKEEKKCIEIIQEQVKYSIYTVLELRNGCLACGMSGGNIDILERNFNKPGWHVKARYHENYGDDDVLKDVLALLETRDEHLVSSSRGGSIKIWDESLNDCKVLGYHGCRINKLLELDDGCVASESTDESIKVWG